MPSFGHRLLLKGLSSANHFGHWLGLNSSVVGGPIGAGNHFQAGGKKVATLLDPIRISLPEPLIYFQGDPNIQNPLAGTDISTVHFEESCFWEYGNVRILPGAHGGLHGISETDRVIPGLNHSCLDENLFFETRFRVPWHGDFVEQGFLLDGGPGANFYHWKIDILPALGFARKVLGPEVKFIINPYSKVREAQWDELGIPPGSRLVSRGPLKVGKLFVVGGLAHQLYGVFRPEPCLEFWKGFPNPEKKRRRLFVSRQDTTKRSLKNESDLLGRLVPFGFERVILDGMSLRAQASLFAEAGDVVGMHGAGFANFIHCEPGTRLIEIFPPGYSHCFYQYICAIVGGTYFPVYSSPADSPAGREFNSQPGMLGEDQVNRIVSIISESQPDGSG